DPAAHRLDCFTRWCTWADLGHRRLFEFGILLVALSQSGHTLSSLDSVGYPIEIDLCRALVRQGNVGMAIFGTSLCTKSIEFVPITGAASVVEFELMRPTKGSPRRTREVNHAAEYLSPRLRQTARKRCGTPCAAAGMEPRSRRTVAAQ